MNAETKQFATSLQLSPADVVILSALSLEVVGVSSPLSVANKLVSCRQTSAFTRALARRMANDMLAEMTNRTWARMAREYGDMDAAEES